MSLTINGNRTGRAAAIELAEQRQWLAEMQLAELDRKRRENAEMLRKAQVIRDSMSQEEYNAWWGATPDDAAGFLGALDEKYNEVLKAQTAAESERVSEWLGLDEAVSIAYGEAVELAGEARRVGDRGRQQLFWQWEEEARNAEMGGRVTIGGGEVQEI